MRKKPERQEPRISAPPPAVAKPWMFAAGAAAALIPCFWSSRIQAGDLGSHIYNAWLAQLVSRGEAPGLEVAAQGTNVLFDLMLSGLLAAAGADIAQRIAVALCVLVFVSGAFAFLRAVTGRWCWEMLALLLPLAYGWVFRMGFFNFYLSLGLCFWALAIGWRFTPQAATAATPLLLVAYAAHALPVAWTVAVVGYTWLARRARSPLILAGISVLAIFVFRIALGSVWTTTWMPMQFVWVTGLDQVWVYDGKYLPVVFVMLGIAVLRIVRALRGKGAAVFAGVPLQLFALTAVGIAFMPGTVSIPAYKHSLAFIAERMSLAGAICLCAALAATPVRRGDRHIMAAAALLFFGFLYRDERSLNSLEDRMAGMVATLPAKQRVIGGIEAPGLRVNAVVHMIDRVCVERCFSYANYEPSTGQFRLRVTGESPVVTSNYEDSWRMQSGFYQVKPRDLPLYQVVLDDGGNMGLRALEAGAQSGITYWGGF